MTDKNVGTKGPLLYGLEFGGIEEHLEGGKPSFVSIDDPLGPDGLPFTADDGLRLRAESKLLGAGARGKNHWCL